MVLSGKRLETRNKMEGMLPFVGASFNKNGVTGFVSNENISKDMNVLGVSYNGAPCVAFYHPYECLFSDDVKRLHLIDHPDNEKVLLFFAVAFNMQRAKYSYGYKFKAERMLRQKLLLPADSEGGPDWDYMESVARGLMIGCIKRELAFLESRKA